MRDNNNKIGKKNLIENGYQKVCVPLTTLKTLTMSVCEMRNSIKICISVLTLRIIYEEHILTVKYTKLSRLHW